MNSPSYILNTNTELVINKIKCLQFIMAAVSGVKL